MKRVLITGAKGLIGEAVAAKLRDLNYDLILHDRRQGDLLKADFKIDQLSGIIHTVGAFEEGSLFEQTEEAFLELFKSNVLSAFHVAKNLIEALKKGRGTLITFGVAGLNLPAKKMAPYLATKNALASLTKSLAYEFQDFGVRANMIALGYVEGGHYSGFPQVKKSEVVALVSYLLSEEARGLTGQIIDLSSGHRI